MSAEMDGVTINGYTYGGGTPPAGMTFEALRVANVTRCEQSFHSLSRWNPLEWAGAAAGEMGEAANLCKKLRRGEDIPVADIGDEIADTVIYLDLLAARLGMNLAACIKRKFNVVSDRVGSEVKL